MGRIGIPELIIIILLFIIVLRIKTIINKIKNFSDSDKEKLIAFGKKILKIIAGLVIVHKILKFFDINVLDGFTNNNEELSNNSESSNPTSIWLDTDGDGVDDTELRDINNDGTFGTLEDELKDDYKKQMGFK
jgi:hypothetical protein